MLKMECHLWKKKNDEDEMLFMGKKNVEDEMSFMEKNCFR